MRDSYPVIRELAPIAPADLAHALSDRPGLVFLDSGPREDPLGHWSFIAADPFARFDVVQGHARWNGTLMAGDPLTRLDEKLALYRVPHDPALPPLPTGAIGFIGYDFGGRLESIAMMPPPNPAEPELSLGFYDVVFAHDGQSKRTYILSSGFPETDDTARRMRAEKRIDEFLNVLASQPPPKKNNPALTQWTSNFDPEAYQRAVSDVITAILNGDIFQANLTHFFSCARPHEYHPWTFYRHLRMMSPAPFGAYLDCGDLILASNSPERFLKLDAHGAIEARPIKGTARRSSDPQEDRILAHGLLSSEKDRAENTMIVDLLRNDLSRIAAPGSVKVPVLCGLETYANVHHLVSVIEARLKPQTTAVDLIRATFPGGSITGAPKIKAMEIIGRLERHPRGAYCGAIGYIGFDGAMDLNITIRTACFDREHIRFGVGGGITALSDPHDEYQETLIKAERLFKAFGASSEGGA